MGILGAFIGAAFRELARRRAPAPEAQPEPESAPELRTVIARPLGQRDDVLVGAAVSQEVFS